MNKKIEKKKEQSEANTSTTPERKTLSQRIKEMGYSTDRIGQGFVMHLPQPKREEKSKINKFNFELKRMD